MPENRKPAPKVRSFDGWAINGRLKLDAREEFAGLVQELDLKRIVVTLREKPTPASATRKFYWAVPVKRIAEHSGHSSIEVHRELKKKYLVGYSEELDGTAAKSTSDLPDAEWDVYLQHCMAECASLGIVIERRPRDTYSEQAGTTAEAAPLAWTDPEFLA